MMFKQFFRKLNRGLAKKNKLNFDKIIKEIPFAHLEELCRAYSKTQQDLDEAKKKF